MVVKEAVLAGPVSELSPTNLLSFRSSSWELPLQDCVFIFDLLALSAKWRMSIWKLVNFHSSLDFVESFVFFCNVTKMINRYHVNNELSAISMCQGTLDIKCITYKYQSCLTHAISSLLCRINRRHQIISLKTRICRSGSKGLRSDCICICGLL